MNAALLILASLLPRPADLPEPTLAPAPQACLWCWDAHDETWVAYTVGLEHEEWEARPSCWEHSIWSGWYEMKNYDCSVRWKVPLWLYRRRAWVEAAHWPVKRKARKR